VSTQGKLKAGISVNPELGGGARLLGRVDFFRLDASRQIGDEGRAELGQFFTFPALSEFMASMFTPRRNEVRLLDAGAGVGSLSAAFVASLSRWEQTPQSVSVTAYEIAPALSQYLQETLDECQAECERLGIRFSGQLLQEDFIEAGAHILSGRLLPARQRSFNCAILNPPYRKINSQSDTRQMLRAVEIETSNLYTAFLSIAARLLETGGELVAITPRSFCNGPYFKAFRKSFLDVMAIRRIHIFDSRSHAFQDDAVLQENIVFHAVKEPVALGAKTIISSSSGPEDGLITSREVDYDQLVRPDDPDRFIRIVPDEIEHEVSEQMNQLGATLSDLGLSVSTGRVVDFRAVGFLRAEPEERTAPLIYPTHIRDGAVVWPKNGSKKPNAILVTPETANLLVPSGVYVLVKRFSSKEERRRVVAAIYDPAQIPAPLIGFENHLNYYHCSGGGCNRELAKGLATFLNSTLVDSYFRQFNGHTQVNATDLRSLKYPTRAELESLGERIGDSFPAQKMVDQLIREELFKMDGEKDASDPVKVKERIQEAVGVLKALGLPTAQQNSRSALTLLALLDLGPETPWAEAASPQRGITEMMKFFNSRYGVFYEPNTRETVRDATMKPFVEAGIAVPNPDKPRAVTSPLYCYQISPEVLELVRTFGTKGWKTNLKTYIAKAGTLRERYAEERKMHLLPVTLKGGKQVLLSPGGQNILVKEIIEQFCPRFTPGGEVLYIGDAATKWAHVDRESFDELGVRFESAGIPMPDVVVYFKKKDWLVLVEAVTSGGAISLARKKELTKIFGASRAGLVFVTAFLTRKDMNRFLGEISWETEVWVAESPTHMIHFNGERFLGPYPTNADETK
jgi:adenine-specific DNA-methyltransferase